MRYCLLCCLFALGACAQNDNPGLASGEPVRDEAVHALMAQRIDSLSRQIQVLAFDQNRTLPELDEDRRRANDEIEAAAGTLAEIALNLTALTETLNLSVANRQQFLSLALQLQETSNQLAIAARDSSASDLFNRITDMQETCTACHNLYRGR